MSAEKREYILSPTEEKLLQMLADGHSYEEMAAANGITFNTASAYVGRLKRRMGCKTRYQMVAEGIRKAVID